MEIRGAIAEEKLSSKPSLTPDGGSVLTCVWLCTTNARILDKLMRGVKGCPVSYMYILKRE